MLQQTSIKTVLPVYERFMKTYPDLPSLAKTTETELRKAVRGLGYYRRFANLLKAAQSLTAATSSFEQRSSTDSEQESQISEWPVTYEEWKALPGIGAYTAAAISSIAFKQPVGVVDGNVERLLSRIFDLQQPIGGAQLKSRFQKVMNDWIDQREPGLFNEAVMELGQTICTKGTPSCSACPLTGICLAYARGHQALSPARKTPRQYQDVSITLHIVQERFGGRFVVQKRSPTATFLKGVPGFLTEVTSADPQISVLSGETSQTVLGDLKNIEANDAAAAALYLGNFRHSITKYRLQVRVMLHAHLAIFDTARFPSSAYSRLATSPDAQWFPFDQVEEHLTANFDRKAWILYRNYRQDLEEGFKDRKKDPVDEQPSLFDSKFMDGKDFNSTAIAPIEISDKLNAKEQRSQPLL